MRVDNSKSDDEQYVALEYRDSMNEGQSSNYQAGLLQHHTPVLGDVQRDTLQHEAGAEEAKDEDDRGGDESEAKCSDDSEKAQCSFRPQQPLGEEGFKNCDGNSYLQQSEVQEESCFQDVQPEECDSFENCEVPTALDEGGESPCIEPSQELHPACHECSHASRIQSSHDGQSERDAIGVAMAVLAAATAALAQR